MLTVLRKPQAISFFRAMCRGTLFSPYFQEQGRRSHLSKLDLRWQEKREERRRAEGVCSQHAYLSMSLGACSGFQESAFRQMLVPGSEGR